jgi:hypothetical protein
MTASAYPSSLPAPNACVLMPAERRQLSASDGARIARALQRDRLGTVSLSFRFTFAEMAIFTAWVRDDLIFGGQWFAASWPLPPGGSWAFKLLGEPRRSLLPGVGWDVSATAEVRGAGSGTSSGAGSGLVLQSAHDPYFGKVVSQLDFHDGTAGLGFYSPPTLNNNASGIVSEDYKGIVWTLYGHNKASVSVGGGALALPYYQGTASGDGPFAFSNVVMQSTGGPLGNLLATGDFTMEFTHNTLPPSGTGGPWNTTTVLFVLSSLYPSSAGALNSVGQWAFQAVQSKLQFTIKSANGTATPSVTIAAYPTSVDNEIAVTRFGGILRIFLNGVLIATQIGVTDATPIGGPITFGGAADGGNLLPNNYGFGTFKRWRYTVGLARYVASYTPTGLPFPTF